VSKAKLEKISPDLDTRTDMPPQAVEKISTALNVLLADTFALYMKTKNFHRHVSGRHFHDYHLMLDEQSDAIFATTDQLAMRPQVVPAEEPGPKPRNLSIYGGGRWPSLEHLPVVMGPGSSAGTTAE
jgi:hypothetical protein